VKILGKKEQPKLLVKDMLQFLEKAESPKERMKYQLESQESNLRRKTSAMDWADIQRGVAMDQNRGGLPGFFPVGYSGMVIVGSMMVAGNFGPESKRSNLP
jgi:hypothetical protein